MKKFNSNPEKNQNEHNTAYSLPQKEVFSLRSKPLIPRHTHCLRHHQEFLSESTNNLALELENRKTINWNHVC